MRSLRNDSCAGGLEQPAQKEEALGGRSSRREVQLRVICCLACEELAIDSQQKKERWLLISGKKQNTVRKSKDNHNVLSGSVVNNIYIVIKM